MVLITGIRQPINPRGATRLGVDDAADELGRCFHRREVPAVLQLGYHPRPIVGGEGPRQAVRPVADLVFEHRLLCSKTAFKDNPGHRRGKLPALTARVCWVLDAINAEQAVRTTAHGANLGIATLEQTHVLVAQMRSVIDMPATDPSARSRARTDGVAGWGTHVALRLSPTV